MEHSRSLNLRKENVLQSHWTCGRLPAGKTINTCVYVCVCNVFIPAVNLIVHYIPSSKSHKTEQVVTKWVKNIDIIVKKSDDEEKEETRGIFKVLKANTHF